MNPINEPVVKAYLKTIETALQAIRTLMDEEAPPSKLNPLEEWIYANDPWRKLWGKAMESNPYHLDRQRAWEKLKKEILGALAQEAAVNSLVETVTTQQAEPAVSTVDTAAGDIRGLQSVGVSMRELLDALEIAWGVIANASGGNWKNEPPQWQEAACRWRGEYFKLLERARIVGPAPEIRPSTVDTAPGSEQRANDLLTRIKDTIAGMDCHKWLSLDQGYREKLIEWMTDCSSHLEGRPAPKRQMGVYTFVFVPPFGPGLHYVVVAESRETAANLINKRLRSVFTITESVRPDQMEPVQQERQQIIVL